MPRPGTGVGMLPAPEEAAGLLPVRFPVAHGLGFRV